MSQKPKDASEQDEQEIVVVLPGDVVTRHVLPPPAAAGSPVPKLGPGLRYDGTNHQVYAVTAGELKRHRNKPVYYVRQNHKRYPPAMEDRVVGIVEDRLRSDGAGGDLYRVHIGAAHTACLSNLSFQGATKRNKPALAPGTVVYARVADTPRHWEPVLSCQLGPHDGGIPRKDWMTSESCYGALVGGTVTRGSTGLARELLHPQNVVLSELAHAAQQHSHFRFEVAIGVNGYLWLHSDRPEVTIMIQNALLNSQVLTEAQVRAMVKSLVYTTQKRIQQYEDNRNNG